jgi:anti-anti-sigma factor
VSRLAEIRTERRDGVPVAFVRGQIDLSNRAEVDDGVTGTLGNVDHGLMVDLTEVGYVDSAGVTLLFALAERLRDRQLQLRLVVPVDNRVRRVLDLVDVGSVAAVDERVDDSVAALRELGAGRGPG